MQSAYKVIKIEEDDFGCEDRIDGYKPRVIVYLKSEDHETSIKQVDQYLYDNDIDVGDKVIIGETGLLEKVLS